MYMSIQDTRVIVNPVIGSHSTYREYPFTSKYLSDKGSLFDYVFTTGAGHAMELARETMTCPPERDTTC